MTQTSTITARIEKRLVSGSDTTSCAVTVRFLSLGCMRKHIDEMRARFLVMSNLNIPAWEIVSVSIIV